MRTWNIEKPKGFTLFSIQDDRVAITNPSGSGTTSGKGETDKVIPFSFITGVTIIESSPVLFINHTGHKVFEEITFKSIEDRNEAFDYLAQLLGPEYEIKTHRPSRWAHILRPLVFIPFLLFFLPIAVMVRSMEQGVEQFTGPPPEDTLGQLAQGLVELICLVGLKIGSQRLFIIIALLFLIIVGTVLVLAFKTPAQMPMERHLTRRHTEERK